MKNITKLKVTFISLALGLSLAISGCSHNPPQTDNMMSTAMTTNAMDHMGSNSMDMSGSSMHNMASNNMNMAHSPETGHMMSDSMKATNQAK